MPPSQQEVERVNDFLKREQTEKARRSLNHALRVSLGLTLVASLALLAATNQIPSMPSFLSPPKQPVALMAHGMGGNPNNDFVGALKRRFEQKNLKVHAPQLPLGNGQTLDVWEPVLSHEADLARNEGPVILLGHSAGASAVLHMVDDNPANTYCGVIVIAGALQGNTPLMYRSFKEPLGIKGKVKGNANLLHGSDDKLLPLPNALALHQYTQIPLTIDYSGVGHYTGLSGSILDRAVETVVAGFTDMASKC